MLSVDIFPGANTSKRQGHFIYIQKRFLPSSKGRIKKTGREERVEQLIQALSGMLNVSYDVC